MSISGITATTGVTAAEPKNKNALEGTTDEFLKLFMAQLQHQDPLDPKNGADMVAQLAQMTAVEQSKAMSNQLADLVASQSSMASASLTGLIGHEVSAGLGAFEVDGKGSVPPISVSSDGAMRGAEVVITDAQGKVIRKIPIADGVKSAEIQWDGKDESGVAVAPGSYSVEVVAGKSAEPIKSQWQGRVDAVELTPDGPRLRIGGLLVAPATIAKIGGLADPLSDIMSSHGARK